MRFKIKAVIELFLNHTPRSSTSNHDGLNVNLIIEKPLEKRSYIKDDGLPNKNGTKNLTVIMAQGLVANIHYAHQKGYWDSAEHLRYIINELEQGFIQIPELSPGTFGNNSKDNEGNI